MQRFRLFLLAVLTGSLFTACETTTTEAIDPEIGQGLAFLEHRLLPGYLYSSDEFLADLRANPLGTMQDLWAKGAGEASAKQIQAAQERIANDTTIYYFTFPKPTDAPLCHALAMVLPDDPEAPRRFIVLEKAGGGRHGITAFLAGWSPKGERIDYGAVADTDLASFKVMVHELLAKAVDEPAEEPAREAEMSAGGSEN